MRPKYGEIDCYASRTKSAPRYDGTYIIELSDGKHGTTDLLVVANGACSKLRAFIRTEEILSFTAYLISRVYLPAAINIGAVSLHTFEADVLPVLKRNWKIVASGQGVAFIALPALEQTANWALSYMTETPPTELRRTIPDEQYRQPMEEVEQRGVMFQEPIQAANKNSDLGTLMVFNKMDKEPFAHEAINGVPEGVSFIGDSNLAVSPFAGKEVNMALNDGFDFAECLRSNGSVQETASTYDRRSTPRATIALCFSHSSNAVIHWTGRT